MTEAPEVAAYVERLEAMLRPVAERAAPEHATQTLIHLLKLQAWSHEQCAGFARSEEKPDETRVWLMCARAIRARVIELHRST